MIKYLSNSPPPMGAFLLRFKQDVEYKDIAGDIRGCVGRLELPITKDTITWCMGESEFKDNADIIMPENNKFGANIPPRLLEPVGYVLEEGKIYKVSHKGGEFLVRCDKFGEKIEIRGQIISLGNILTSDTFKVPGTFAHYIKEDSRTCQLAFQDDIRWYETCEKAGKFVTKQNALKPPQEKWVKDGWARVIGDFTWNNKQYYVGDLLQVDRECESETRRVYLEDGAGCSVYANKDIHHMPEVEWVGMTKPVINKKVNVNNPDGLKVGDWVIKKEGNNFATKVWDKPFEIHRLSDNERYVYDNKGHSQCTTAFRRALPYDYAPVDSKLQEVMQKYPAGTKFTPAHAGNSGQIYTVVGCWEKKGDSLYQCAVLEKVENLTPVLYYYGVWAPIVKEEPKSENLWPDNLLTDKSLVSDKLYVRDPEKLLKITVHSKNHINTKVEEVKSIPIEIKTKSKKVYF